MCQTLQDVMSLDSTAMRAPKRRASWHGEIILSAASN